MLGLCYGKLISALPQLEGETRAYFEPRVLMAQLTLESVRDSARENEHGKDETVS
jgi:hypothetical protein